MPHQPIPDVTQDDVERIVRRDFPAIKFEDVIAILAEYVTQGDGGAIRVRLAALKLADGDLDSLRKHIATANRDYRDVLVAAEYTEFWKATSRVHTLPRSEHERLFDADWKQYENWLRR